MSDCNVEGSFPEPLDCPEVGEILRSRYNGALKDSGVTGTVLVSVDIDANGVVTSATAIKPQLPDGMQVLAAMDEGDGDGWIAAETSDNPDLQKIAEQAARAQRFTPSMRDGEAVPYEDFRMSYVFARR